jgi:hypothetical protein
VELLPLREDYEENKPIYSMIVKLCKLIPVAYTLVGSRS